MNADGTGIRQLTSPNNPEQCSEGTSASDLKPDWSPDGEKILFERQFGTDENGGFDCGLDGYGYIAHVYVMNADGSAARRLRSAGLWDSDASPAWSPDGRFIAYSSQIGGIFVVSSDGGSVAQSIDMHVTGRALNPVWSPDGTKLLFLSAEPPRNLLSVHDLASGANHILGFSNVPGLLLDPAWSR
jgi:Tol biopolymer transport system component